MNRNTEKNQGWHYDTSPIPKMVKDEDGKYEISRPEYYQCNGVDEGLTNKQYFDIMLTAITGVPIDRIDITITADQLEALKRKHGAQMDQFFTKL